MSRFDELLINKIINEDKVDELLMNNITKEDMVSDVSKESLRFIEDYAEKNGGRAPSYAVISESVEGFEYIPEITDSYKYLVKKIKDHTAKRMVVDIFQTGEFNNKINDLEGSDFVENWLPDKLETIKKHTKINEDIGTSVKNDGSKFMEEYGRRKAGESFNIWESKFSSIGEYTSGNMYTLFGESGRGKSVFMLEDAIHAARQGASVVLWSLEMGWYEVMVRLYTSISGDARLMSTYYDGTIIDSGFNARHIRTGQLLDTQKDPVEDMFKLFVDNIDDYLEGDILIRSVDDDDFGIRTLKVLEADIKRVNADFVVVDPFYYMDYEKNEGRTTGGDAANTSMKMRAMAGQLDVVMLALTQASAKTSEKSEDGHRELKMPEREDVKKASNLMEDAAILIGVDSDYKQGIGLVGILKGRDGGEGDMSHVTYLPQFGIIDEIAVGEDAMEGYDF